MWKLFQKLQSDIVKIPIVKLSVLYNLNVGVILFLCNDAIFDKGNETYAYAYDHL